MILDRGYPAAWLVAYLTEHYIRFCMRCEKSSGGWAEVRTFERSDQVDATVTLNKPNQWDCEDYGCSGAAPRVRLVKCVTPNGLVRVMATNLPDSQVPTAAFGELYHERWRIEEAFKRLKHRCKLESVSGADAACADGRCAPRCWLTFGFFGVHGRVSGSGFTGQAAYM
ncbi:MAG: transposase [Comamonadaceae bacterium]|nr:transposase [Comamonadaceae bacterium]